MSLVITQKSRHRLSSHGSVLIGVCDSMDMKSMALNMFNLRASVAITVSNLDTSRSFQKTLDAANSVGSSHYLPRVQPN